MQKVTHILLLIFIPFIIFAGGQAESGRDTNMDTIEAGQFINPAMVDAYEYILVLSASNTIHIPKKRQNTVFSHCR